MFERRIPEQPSIALEIRVRDSPRRLLRFYRVTPLCSAHNGHSRRGAHIDCVDTLKIGTAFLAGTSGHNNNYTSSIRGSQHQSSRGVAEDNPRSWAHRAIRIGSWFLSAVRPGAGGSRAPSSDARHATAYWGATLRAVASSPVLRPNRNSAGHDHRQLERTEPVSANGLWTPSLSRLPIVHRAGPHPIQGAGLQVIIPMSSPYGYTVDSVPAK